MFFGVQLTEFARENRKRPTREEATVWRWLRDRRFGNFKFRRQYTLDRYILDFYCPELKLAIEIDGRGHAATFANEMRDVDRDCELSIRGITVVRITNDDIRRYPEFVADRIIAEIARL